MRKVLKLFNKIAASSSSPTLGFVSLTRRYKTSERGSRYNWAEIPARRLVTKPVGILTRLASGMTTLTMLLLLTSCNLTPQYVRPAPPIPELWNDQATITTTTGKATAPFWQQIEDEELKSLIETSLKQNLDIESALQRTMQARAQAKIAGADLLPSVDTTFGGSRSFDKSSDGDYSQSSTLRSSVRLSYEVDLWQRNRAGAKSAAFKVNSSHFDQDAVTIGIVSDVITNYAELITLQKRIEVAKKALSNAEDILTIIEARFAEGSNSSLEVAQQKTSIYGFRASITSLEKQFSASHNALAILTGATPQQFKVTTDGKKLPELPAINLTPPSMLLVNRPDIRRVEAELLASNADIGAARAALYPSFTIGADAGVIASSFVNPAATALELSSSILAPIFSGGKLHGGVEKNEARKKELAATYKKTILVALQETEDALSNLKAAHQQTETYTSATTSAGTAYKMAKERFDAGSIDFLNLLDSQRTLLQAEDNMVQADFDEFAAVIQLHKAMGWVAPSL